MPDIHSHYAKPGVKVEVEADNGVILYGEDGKEIVSWNIFEMEEDPISVCMGIAYCMKVLYEEGGNKLRVAIDHPDGY